MDCHSCDRPIPDFREIEKDLGMRCSRIYTRCLFAVIILGLVGCSGKSNPVAGASPKLLAAIERGYCYGDCQIFSLKIYFDGAAAFWGEQNTQVLGEKVFALTDEQVSQVRSEFLRKGFLFVNNDCCKCGDTTGEPSTLITYQGNGPFKQVKYYHGCGNWTTENLAGLETSILKLTGARAWIEEGD